MGRRRAAVEQLSAQTLGHPMTQFPHPLLLTLQGTESRGMSHGHGHAAADLRRPPGPAQLPAALGLVALRPSLPGQP